MLLPSAACMQYHAMTAITTDGGAQRLHNSFDGCFLQWEVHNLDNTHQPFFWLFAILHEATPFPNYIGVRAIQQVELLDHPSVMVSEAAHQALMQITQMKIPALSQLWSVQTSRS